MFWIKGGRARFCGNQAKYGKNPTEDQNVQTDKQYLDKKADTFLNNKWLSINQCSEAAAV